MLISTITTNFSAINSPTFSQTKSPDYKSDPLKASPWIHALTFTSNASFKGPLFPPPAAYLQHHSHTCFLPPTTSFPLNPINEAGTQQQRFLLLPKTGSPQKSIPTAE